MTIKMLKERKIEEIKYAGEMPAVHC